MGVSLFAFRLETRVNPYPVSGARKCSLPRAPIPESSSLCKPLTATDLAELEKIFLQSGIGSAADVARAAKENDGLGLFVRSLIGLDRAAAKEALGSFLDGKTPGANQIEFVNEIVDYLTEHGSIPIERLYEPPYTDFHPLGVEGMFPEPERARLITILQDIRGRAAAS